MTQTVSNAALRAELKERLFCLIDEGDEQRLARLQMFLHREESSAEAEEQGDDEDLDTMQGYTKEENEKFLDECERIADDMMSGKEKSYTIEEAKAIIYGRKPIE